MRKAWSFSVSSHRKNVAEQCLTTNWWLSRVEGVPSHPATLPSKIAEMNLPFISKPVDEDQAKGLALTNTLKDVIAILGEMAQSYCKVGHFVTVAG